VKLTALSLTLVLTLSLIACSPLERQAYNVIVGAKAFLDVQKKLHPECTVQPNTTAICIDLARATAAKDLLIDAAEVYCSGPQFENGGACQPPAKGTPAAAQAAAKLKAAIGAYNQIQENIKVVTQQ
jgi:hypothetical protein